MSYLTTVLADAPTHLWRCADPGGLLLHDVGSAPVAMEHFSWNSQLPYAGPNSDGGSFYCPGAGATRTNQQHDPLVSLPLSLECWFWPWSAGFNATVVMSAWNAANNSIVSARFSGGAVQVFTLGGNVTAGVVNFQHWNHLVVAVTVAGGSVYLNGALIGTTAGAGMATQAVSYGACCDSNNGSGVSHQSIAELAVYPSALSAARVAAHFLAADQVGQRPVYKGNGSFNVVSGVTSITSDLAALILASVRKSY